MRDKGTDMHTPAEAEDELVVSYALTGVCSEEELPARDTPEPLEGAEAAREMEQLASDGDERARSGDDMLLASSCARSLDLIQLLRSCPRVPGVSALDLSHAPAGHASATQDNATRHTP